MGMNSPKIALFFRVKNEVYRKLHEHVSSSGETKAHFVQRAIVKLIASEAKDRERAGLSGR